MNPIKSKKMKKALVLIPVILLLSVGIEAQTSRMFIPLDIKKAYENKTRSLDGRPGENYWQNSADYRISATLDPDNYKITGSEEITYKNNSPDTLKNLVVRLYQDLFRKGAARDFQIDPDDLTDGVTISRFVVNGSPVELDPVKPGAAGRYGTNLEVRLPAPIGPKNEARIEIDWSLSIPRKIQLRMGCYDPAIFFIAYWYPQIAVYDDLYGWDRLSYKGMVEFYNDFNNYDVKITVPEKFGVWATGVLQNANDNYNPEICDKIEKAKKSDDIVHVIDSADIIKGSYTRTGSNLTYHFRAENVTDFAFAAGNKMLWDASTVKLNDGREVLVSSINHKDVAHYEEIAGYARKSIEYFSTQMPGIPYPYPSMTVFNHPGGGGMEYPMMTNDGISEYKEANAGVTAHEISHTYMPFYFGTNERRHAWMDEGWAVMFTYDAIKSMFPESKPRDGNGAGLSFLLGREEEIPPMVNSNLLAGGDGMSYSVASYTRSGVAYDFLRGVIGEELFRKALKEYAARWNGKHPGPYDFFFTFSDMAGENLDWYWQPWFFEKGYAELGIKEVKLSRKTCRVIISREGILPVPVNLTITHEDGTTEEVLKPASVWKNGNTELSIEFKPTGKVNKITLGAPWIPDTDQTNNSYVFVLEKAKAEMKK